MYSGLNCRLDCALGFELVRVVAVDYVLDVADSAVGADSAVAAVADSVVAAAVYFVHILEHVVLPEHCALGRYELVCAALEHVVPGHVVAPDAVLDYHQAYADFQVYQVVADSAPDDTRDSEQVD